MSSPNAQIAFTQIRHLHFAPFPFLDSYTYIDL